MIDTALNIFSRGEWYALIGAVLFGSFATEAIKRTGRHFVSWRAPLGLWPIVAFALTAAAAYALWPRDGVFPHPLFAACLIGLIAPTLYKLTTAGLRRTRYAWVAGVLTGERRRQQHRVRRDRRGRE